MSQVISWVHTIFGKARERGAEEARQGDPYYRWLVEQQEQACESVSMLKEAREEHELIKVLRHERTSEDAQ
jgi:hypothetical protein